MASSSADALGSGSDSHGLIKTASLLSSPRIQRRLQSTRASTASLASNTGSGQQQLIDGSSLRPQLCFDSCPVTETNGHPFAVFLQEVQGMGDRTPTADEIAVARQYLQLLTAETLRDYLRSTDELLAQVPTEFTQKLRQVEDAESFIYICSSGEVEPAERMLDSSWEVCAGSQRTLKGLTRHNAMARHTSAFCS